MEESTAEITGSLVRTSAKSGISAHRTRLTIEDSVITENGSGGILLENSQAGILRNNIVNNGEWEIKKCLTMTEMFMRPETGGAMKIPSKPKLSVVSTFRPPLKSPIDFSVLDN